MCRGGGETEGFQRYDGGNLVYFLKGGKTRGFKVSNTPLHPPLDVCMHHFKIFINMSIYSVAMAMHQYNVNLTRTFYHNQDRGIPVVLSEPFSHGGLAWSQVSHIVDR